MTPPTYRIARSIAAASLFDPVVTKAHNPPAIAQGHNSRPSQNDNADYVQTGLPLCFTVQHIPTGTEGGYYPQQPRYAVNQLVPFLIVRWNQTREQGNRGDEGETACLDSGSVVGVGVFEDGSNVGWRNNEVYQGRRSSPRRLRGFSTTASPQVHLSRLSILVVPHGNTDATQIRLRGRVGIDG